MRYRISMAKRIERDQWKRRAVPSLIHLVRNASMANLRRLGAGQMCLIALFGGLVQGLQRSPSAVFRNRSAQAGRGRR